MPAHNSGAIRARPYSSSSISPKFMLTRSWPSLISNRFIPGADAGMAAGRYRSTSTLRPRAREFSTRLSCAIRLLFPFGIGPKIGKCRPPCRLFSVGLVKPKCKMEIREEYHKWHSPIVGREFEMLVFGHAGLPVILFPTSKGSYYQYKDQGMIEKIRWFLENGKVKIYCPDS